MRWYLTSVTLVVCFISETWEFLNNKLQQTLSWIVGFFQTCHEGPYEKQIQQILLNISYKKYFFIFHQIMSLRVMRSLNLSNTCFFVVQNLLSSHLLPKNLWLKHKEPQQYLMIEGATEQGAKHVNCDLRDRPKKEKTRGNTVHIKWIQTNTDNQNYPNVNIYLDIFPSAAFPLPAGKKCALPTRKLWHQGYLIVRYDLAVQT